MYTNVVRRESGAEHGAIERAQSCHVIDSMCGVAEAVRGIDGASERASERVAMGMLVSIPYSVLRTRGAWLVGFLDLDSLKEVHDR